MSVLAGYFAIALSCSGHVRLGSRDSLLDFDSGEWEASELVLIFNDSWVDGIPLPEGFEFYETRRIEPRQPQHEFQYSARLENSRDRTTAMAVFVTFSADGFRQVSWNGGELVGSHHSYTVSSGRFACVEFPPPEVNQ